MKEFPEVFTDQLGAFKHHHATLHLKEGTSPRYHRPRTIPFALKDSVETEIQRLVREGILEPVNSSEWAAPIVVVPKKDGRLRICGDYKVTINPSLKIDTHPLPKPQELFASLAGGKLFTKLDLSQAYQQMRLDDSSKELVTINTHKGLFRYTRLPFGVASAPAIFQRAMDNIMQGIPRVHCYIDDILISGVSDEEHIRNLRTVLQRLRDNGITLKVSKCQFLQESVEYLGHVVDQEGLHTAPSKLTAIRNAPTPKNIRELRSFLGLINYYGRFLPSLSKVLFPLNQLLRHNVKWNWSKQCDAAFTDVKNKLLSAKVLMHYNPQKEITLATDASSYGLGAVLSHTTPFGDKPIAFASRTLSQAECNYSQIEKEALSIVFGVKKFHQYLYGRTFSLLTDHQPLVTIFGPKTGVPALAAARLQRWAITLSAYSFHIGYRRTKDHGNADGLSRLPLPISPPSKPDVVSKFHLVHMSSLPLTHIQLRSASRADPVVSKVMTYTLQGWPQFVQDELQVYWRRRMELTVEADCLMWGLRVVVPEKCRKKILEELHEGHPGVVRMKSQARSHVWWPGIDHDIENLVKACSPCIQIKSDPSPVPLHPWVWPSRPWYRLHVDFAGPLFDKTYLVVVDAYSKWPEVWEMGSTSSAKTIEVMQQLFSKYGLPEQIVSDNGPQFRSSEFGEFLSQLGVKHYRSAVYHPATNGQVERFVKTLKQALKAGYLEGQPAKRTLLNFMLQYRSTPHTVTGSSPGQLFLGRPLRTKLDLLRPDHRKRVEQQQDKQKYYHDERRRRQMSLSPGDRVWIKMYRKGLHRWEQGQVQQIIGTRLVHILLSTGEQVTRHMDQIQRAKDIEEEQTYSSDNDVDIEIGLNHEPLLNEAPTGSPEAQSPSPPATCTRRYPDRVRRPPNRPWFVNDF